MSQSCTSMSFRGVHRRKQRKEVERVRVAVIQVADPDSEHWQTLAAERGYQLSQSLPSFIDADEAWDCLGAWADEASAQRRAEGYRAGLDYLADCKTHRTAPHLDTLLSRIRGKLWHVADLTAERNHAIDDAEALAEAQYARDMRAEMHN